MLWKALLLVALLVGCAAPPRTVPPTRENVASPTDVELRAAVERTLPLLQASMDTWLREVSCLSCHHQALGTMAVVMADERGVAIDDALHARQLERLRTIEVPAALQGEAGINGTFGRSFQLVALAAAGSPRDVRTDALARFLAGNAVRRGGAEGESLWLSTSYRPPLEASRVTGTAFALRALDLFRPDARAEDAAETIARARRYLEGLEPRDAEERAMRLFGLAWSGASARRIRSAADDVLAAQRPDGGWAQLVSLESDAYATGQALVALQQAAGLAPSTPAVERGVRFLLDRQLDDGSWLVETRRRSPGLPYFETGFPHRAHQFVSTAATAWATMALCSALDPAPSVVFHGPRPPRSGEAEDVGLEAVHLAAAFGTRADVEAALDGGVDPNARGVDGLTPLHLAVHDAELVRLLLARGAEVDARTTDGTTPLLLAAWHATGDDAAALLSSRGAAVDARPTDSGTTPFLRAVRSSKLELAGRLLERGADVDATDAEGLTALHWAASGADAEMVRFLLDTGAAVDPRCDGETPLLWASHDGYDEVVRLLLSHGADPDLRGEFGMTPVAWAAKVDHGNVRTLDALLASGADASLASTNGRTPLDWAVYVGNAAAVERLRARSDAR